MTRKRLILSVLTLIVALLIGRSLVTSWSQPQISSRLQLYQTDLLLHASELQPSEDDDLASARAALLGEDPLKTALEQYQSVYETAETSLKQFQARLQKLDANAADADSVAAVAATRTVESAIRQQQDLLDQLDLRMGILQAKQDQPTAALETWTKVKQRSAAEAASAQTALVLSGLWSDPPRLLPDAEPQIQAQLDGWFRNAALTQLYQLQQRSDALSDLQTTQQQVAEQTFLKLALIGTAPILGGIVGAVILTFLLIQRLTQGKQAVLALDQSFAWETPWNWETVWQVLIVGFFFVGQIAVPLVLGLLGGGFAAFGTRSKAVFSLTYYLLLAGSGLLVLYGSVKPFFPLPEDWFRLKPSGRWWLWGIGGYLVALPLMLGVSLINQQIWQGQGGSNPLLQIVLEEGDRVSLAIFLFTAAVAAPIFEETLFRGFLLPSLTRYLPVWGAIAVSSLLFAVAHLSLSEVLPLSVLGAVLGFVYTRSRSLLSSMLLHSLWNSVTMIGLFLLGRGVA